MDKAEFSFSQQDWRQVEELVRQAKPLITDETLLGDVSTKGRANFVTHCDTAVQDFLQRQLAARWPEIQFLGEEAAAAPDFSGAVWVLDPVDGHRKPDAPLPPQRRLAGADLWRTARSAG